jgi:hypothetical protein
MRSALSLGLLLALAIPAAALGQTRIYSDAGGGGFPVEPSRLEYSKAHSGAGESITLRGLDWRSWGNAKAISDGRLSACPDRDSCFVTDAELKAKRKQRSGAISYYTKLVVSFGQNRITIELPLPTR